MEHQLLLIISTEHGRGLLQTKSWVVPNDTPAFEKIILDPVWLTREDGNNVNYFSCRYSEETTSTEKVSDKLGTKYKNDLQSGVRFLFSLTPHRPLTLTINN